MLPEKFVLRSAALALALAIMIPMQSEARNTNHYYVGRTKTSSVANLGDPEYLHARVSRADRRAMHHEYYQYRKDDQMADFDTNTWQRVKPLVRNHKVSMNFGGSWAGWPNSTVYTNTWGDFRGERAWKKYWHVNHQWTPRANQANMRHSTLAESVRRNFY